MKAVALQLLVLLGLTLIAAAATKAFHPDAPDWFLDSGEADLWRVTLEDVEERWSGDVFWIDARTLEEFEAGHHEGAIHLTSEAVGKPTEVSMMKLESVMTAGKPIVIYCDGKACGKSKELAEQLREDMGLGDEIFYLGAGWEVLKPKN